MQVAGGKHPSSARAVEKPRYCYIAIGRQIQKSMTRKIVDRRGFCGYYVRPSYICAIEHNVNRPMNLAIPFRRMAYYERSKKPLEPHNHG
jgi:hypothetical protein